MIKLQQPAQLPLICNEKKCISIDKYTDEDEWKVDYLDISEDNTIYYDNGGLQAVDIIWKDWLKNLSMAQLQIINSTNNLIGIPMPKEWIVVWRWILKEPKLRDSFKAARNGKGLMSFAYYWCVWAEECMKKYLSPMEKEIVELNDSGIIRDEIGLIMLEKYGDKFWKPRKKDTTTTPTQVVNNYFYLKMPTHIAKAELIDLAKKEYKIRKQNEKKSKR